MADLNTILEKHKGVLELIDGKVCKTVSDTEKYINSVKDFVENGRFICEFGTWNGDFNCNGLGLTSLEGSPKTVNGTFDCHKNSITSLVGGPKEVGKDYICYKCKNLESLEGAPEKILRDFVAYENEKLTNLVGSPKTVERNFDVSDCGLTSLEGKPKSVGHQFITIGNKGLK